MNTNATSSPSLITQVGWNIREVINFSYEGTIPSVGKLIDALDQIKFAAAYMLRTDYLRKDWEINDLQIDHRAIFDAIQRKNLQEACALVSDRTVRTLSASGTPEDFQSKLDTYLKAGVGLPVIFPSGDIQTMIKTMQLAVEVGGRSQ
jgi:hypothetical protein